MGRGGKDKEWTDCVAEDRRVLGITVDWSTAALDLGAWYNTMCEEGCRFMAAWVRQEEKGPKTGRGRQRQKRQTRLRLHLR